MCFLSAEYALLPFKITIFRFLYCFKSPKISFGISSVMSESRLPLRLQVFITSQSANPFSKRVSSFFDIQNLISQDNCIKIPLLSKICFADGRNTLVPQGILPRALSLKLKFLNFCLPKVKNSYIYSYIVQVLCLKNACFYKAILQQIPYVVI